MGVAREVPAAATGALVGELKPKREDERQDELDKRLAVVHELQVCGCILEIDRDSTSFTYPIGGFCHGSPQVMRSQSLLGYHGGEFLKLKRIARGSRVLPLNQMECGFLYACYGNPRTGGRGGLEGSGRMEPSRPATSFVMRSINMCWTSGRGRPSECGCTGCWGNASIPCAQAICVAAILPNGGGSLCDSELLFNGQQPQKAHLEALPEARVWFRPIHHLRLVLLRHPLDIPVRV